MTTQTELTPSAPAEAQSGAAVRVHPLVRPFERENTAAWHERQRIRSALEDIHAAADEASRCLEMDERLQQRLPQAEQALRELEVAIRALWPNEKLTDSRPR